VRHDALYPVDLEDLRENAPSQLWMRGAPEVLERQPRVAIVGTRRMSPYGRRITEQLAATLARAGACIVSGLAVGIDGTAHRAALDAGGTTIAVLGTGMNFCFPKANRRLQIDIASRGLLLTELEANDHGWKSTFLDRNRIIAALAKLVIVVEAPRKSGALNTAKHAEALNRSVGAVPGPIDQDQSVGTNGLLRDGAQVITCVEDALSLVGLTPPPRRPRVDPLSDEGRVWSALAGGDLDVDSLCHLSGLPAERCMAAITRLEIAGSVECELTGTIRRRC